MDSRDERPPLAQCHLRDEGKAYPRTCAICRLGPCPYTAKAQPAPVTPMDSVSKGAVTQADREAAWDFRPEGYGPIDAENWMHGRYDDNRFIQAFAAHRARFQEATRLAVVEEVQEAFLNMLADASRFDEDVDGDVDNYGRPTMTIDYHLTVGHSQLQELCDTLGIKARGYDETLKDAIDAAIAEPPSAIRALQPKAAGQ